MSSITFKRNSLSSKIEDLLSTVNVITKRLKIQKVGVNNDKRKLVISTNWLGAVNFNEGDKVTETVISEADPAGMRIAPEPNGGKQVYARNYADRDRETLMDIRHQDKLDKAFGSATHVIVRFQPNLLTILPDHAFSNKSISEGVSFKLSDKVDGIYHGILRALNFIKKNAFESLAINAPAGFEDSQEYTLFCMQLRRLGYELNESDCGRIVAQLNGSEIQSHTPIDLPHDKPIRPDSIEFNESNPLSTFVACTGGVDVACLESDDFSVTNILEIRPAESRDYKKSKDKDGQVVIKHSDKTETTAICAAINAKAPKAILNEDLYHFKYHRTSELLERNNFLHISLQCCDFSNLKNMADRMRAIENLESTRDMIFPALDLIEDSQIPTVLIENVRNFYGSVECRILEKRLEELGYNVFTEVLSAKDSNCHTMRTRCYLFATKLSCEFSFPASLPRTANVWRDVIAGNMGSLRDVSHTKSVSKAITTGRLRALCEGDDLAPTLTRSQNRQVKDSLYVKINDRFYMPDIKMMKDLMGVPKGFDTSLFSNEIASEIIGQSIECPMHIRICQSIKNHILDFMEAGQSILMSTKEMIKPAPKPLLLGADVQLALF